MKLGIAFMAFALAWTASANIIVLFYTDRGTACNGGVSHEYRSAICNVCIRAPHGYPAVQTLGVTADQRVSYHSDGVCGSGTEEGQWYGSQCVGGGSALIQSVYVACVGFRTGDNTTVIGDATAQEVKTH